MNYTNKDFYARISRVEDLNFSVRRDVELQLAQGSAATKDSSGIQAECKAQSEIGYSRGPLISRAASSVRNNGGSGGNLTKANNATHSTEDSYVVIAITEGRGHAEGEIGLAAMDVNSPSLILSQISDAFWYRDTLLKLEVFNPSEIIIPLTVFNSGSKLLDEIKTCRPNITITPIPRRHFSDNNVLNAITSLSTTNCKSILKIIEKKYYAMSAAAGLLAYVKNVLMMNFVPNSLRIEFQSKSSRVLIDYECFHRLELLYSLVESKEKRCCLFGFLNNTLTAVGARCLRAYVLEPYFNVQEISDRQNCIKELLGNHNYLYAAQECLKKFSCCDQLLKICILPPEEDKIKSIELMINRVLLLKSTLENIAELRNILKSFTSDTFKKMFNVLKDTRYEGMLNEIKKVIQPEISSVKSTAQCFQRIYAIKSGICEYLDFMRGIYSTLIEQIRGTVNELATKHGLALRMIYSVPKGFHMQLTSPKKNPVTNIPSGLDIMCQKGSNYYLTNSDLYQLNIRMTDVIEELHLASYRVARNFIETILKNSDANYDLIGVISNLDIIVSLAKVSTKDGYCCPQFGSETRIVDAVHPFLEYTSATPIPIPNNIMGTPDYNFYIITGPNMGGKTLYIKMIAVLQIMAQLGCYVPAKEAKFRLCDRIFARIGFEDRVEKDSSSYVKEMKEFQYILANITARSLLIIDEICRNTNPEEGKQIAFKICQNLANIYLGSEIQSNQVKTEEGENARRNFKLLSSTSPFIYLTTHFIELTKLSEDHLNISNLFLHADENVKDGKLHLTYTHKVMEGVTPIRGYGLALARTVRFPRRILQRAEEIYEQLLIHEKNHHQNGIPIKDTRNSILHTLEESFKNRSQATQLCQRSAKSVSNFLSKTTQIVSQLETTSFNANKNAPVDLNSCFYDIYTQILTILRENLPGYMEKCRNLVKDFLQNQPKELVEAIHQIDSNDFRDLIISSTHGIASNRNTEAASGCNEKDKTNLLELSYHSLLRRLQFSSTEPELNLTFQHFESLENLLTPKQNQLSRYNPSQNYNLSSSSNPNASMKITSPSIIQTCPGNLLQANQPQLISNTGYHTFPGVSRSFNFNDEKIDSRRGYSSYNSTGTTTNARSQLFAQGRFGDFSDNRDPPRSWDEE